MNGIDLDECLHDDLSQIVIYKLNMIKRASNASSGSSSCKQPR